MLIFAHRGDRSAAPENTMPAFRKALAIGAPAIEMDVQLTKDGEMVVCHDHNIDRTSNGRGWIRDFTLAELKSFDFGSWFDPRFAGEKIPTFAEFFSWFVTTPLLLNIEIKNSPVVYHGIEEKLVALIKKIAPADFDIYNRIIISSFHHPSLVTIKEIDPRFKTAVLFWSRPIDMFTFIEQTKADYLHPDWSFVQADWVKEAHARHIGVNAYTVNEEDEFAFIANSGIDGIFTDCPQRWLQHLKKEAKE